MYAATEFNVVRWNGTSWSTIGSAFNSSCQTLAIANGSLYAGGAFTMNGAVSTPYIAQWTGTSWSSLGSGLNDTCSALTTGTDGSLYAGGVFTTAGGISANGIAKWNGSWSALGNGLNSTCQALAIGADGSIYSGGTFMIADGISTNRISQINNYKTQLIGSFQVGQAPLTQYNFTQYCASLTTISYNSTWYTIAKNP